MDRSSLNRGRLGSSVRMSMTVSEEEDAAAMRDSCSSSTIETTAMAGACGDERLLGSVLQAGEWEKVYVQRNVLTSSRTNAARNAAVKDMIAEMRQGRT